MMEELDALWFLSVVTAVALIAHIMLDVLL